MCFFLEEVKKKMVLQSSGPISLGNLCSEFDVSTDAPRKLSAFYKAAGLVSDEALYNANVPTSGLIRLGQLRGAANATPVANSSTWASYMTRTSWGADPNPSYMTPTGTAPDQQIMMANASPTQYTAVVGVLPNILNNASVTMTCEFLITNENYDGFALTLGCIDTTATNVNYNYHSVAGYTVGFQVYDYPQYRFPRNSVNVMAGYDPFSTDPSVRKFMQSNVSTIASNSWKTVKLTYTKGTSNTIVVNYNGSNVITYSDPNNANTINTAGSYFGVTSTVGSPNTPYATVYVRRFNISYDPSDAVVSAIPVANSSTWPSSLVVKGNWTNSSAVAPSYMTPTGTAPNQELMVSNGRADQYLYALGNTAINLMNVKSATMSFEFLATGGGDGWVMVMGMKPGNPIVQPNVSRTWGTCVGGLGLGFTCYDLTAYGFPINRLNLMVGYTPGPFVKVAQVAVPTIASGTWKPVKITYTKGTSNTIVVNYNGSNVITYNDTDNANTVATGGGYWGVVGESGGGSNLTLKFRGFNLSYDTYDVVSAYPPVSISPGSSLPAGNSISTTVTGQARGNGTYVIGWSSYRYGTAYVPQNAFDFNRNVSWSSDQFSAIRSYNNGVSNYSAGTAGIPYTGNTTTVMGGVSYLGEWLQLQLPNAINLKHYFIEGQSYNGNYPHTWYIGGSNDGSTWTLLDTRTSIPASTNVKYTLASVSTPYSYFRMVINRTNFDPAASVGELRFFGY